eukprot:PhF_6_TR19738/c0_g1_i1/m.28804
MDFVEGGGMGPALNHPATAIVGSLVLWLLTFMILLFQIFLVQKIDGAKADWPWRNVFAPIWVIDSTVGIGCVLLIVQLTKNVSWAGCMNLVLMLIAFVAPICICLGLEGAITSWTAALSPMLALSLYTLVTAIPSIRFKNYIENLAFHGIPTDGMTRTSLPYVLHVTSTILGAVSSPLTYGLLCGKLDGALDESFYSVFAPTITSWGLSFFIGVGTVWHNYRTAPPEQNLNFCQGFVVPTLVQGIGYGLILLFFFLLLEKIENIANRSLAEVMSPLFVIVSVLMLATMCLSCVMAAQVSQARAQNSPYGEAPPPGPATTPQQESVFEEAP